MSQQKKKYCVNCFFIMEVEEQVCRNCSYTQNEDESPLYLRPPFRLNQQFYVGRVLGHGGFAITYLAYDRNLSMTVAIKEYFPIEFSTRAADGVTVQPYDGQSTELFHLGKDKFIAEARLLATLRSKNIITIRQFFTVNNTAYFVMEYIEGDTLTEYVRKRGGQLPYEEARGFLLSLLDALEEVHSKNAFHRDIKPDNIYITKEGEPILLDFGAARHTVTGRTTNLMSFLTPGFAPAEQYSVNGIQGPWTDVYSLAATFYYALTGQIPPVPYDRMFGESELIPPSQLGSDIPPEEESWLLNALEIRWSQRPDSIRSWRAMIDPQTVAVPEIDPAVKVQTAEENFTKIAILPKLSKKILTRKDEEEIYASAAFMEIPLDRVMVMVEEALSDTESERREMTPEEVESLKREEELQKREEELERKEEELEHFEQLRFKEEEMWIEAEIAELEAKKKAQTELDKQALEREAELQRREEELERKQAEIKHFEELRNREEEMWFEAEMASIEEKHKELDELLNHKIDDQELKSQISNLTEEKARLQEEDRLRDLETKRQSEELYQEKMRLRKALERRANVLNQREADLKNFEAELKQREAYILQKEAELGIAQDDYLTHLEHEAQGASELKRQGSDLDQLSEAELEDLLDLMGESKPQSNADETRKKLALGKDALSLDAHYARLAAEMPQMEAPVAQIIPFHEAQFPESVANALGMEFKLIENLEHASSFYIQSTPVTQAQWREVMENNPAHFDDNPEHPVERVSWEDCQLFIHRLNLRQEAKYRLPKDLEWEYACRAESQTKYFFGDDPQQLGEYAWFEDNSNERSHPVARKKPNAFGLYDMLGNVREWVQERNEAVPQPNARIVRGGSWDASAEECTPQSTGGEPTGLRMYDLGFRLVIDIS